MPKNKSKKGSNSTKQTSSTEPNESALPQSNMTKEKYDEQIHQQIHQEKQNRQKSQQKNTDTAPLQQAEVEEKRAVEEAEAFELEDVIQELESPPLQPVSNTFSPTTHQQLCETVCTLYDSSNSDKKSIINNLYDDACVFADPIVSVKGKTNTTAQFAGLKYLFSASSAKLESYTVNKTNELHMTTTQRYTLRFIPIELFFRVLTVMILSNSATNTINAHTNVVNTNNAVTSMENCTLFSTRKIVSHRDDWAITSVVSNVPILGRVMESLVRPAVGWTSSQFIKVLQTFM